MACLIVCALFSDIVAVMPGFRSSIGPPPRRRANANRQGQILLCRPRGEALFKLFPVIRPEFIDGQERVLAILRRVWQVGQECRAAFMNSVLVDRALGDLFGIGGLGDGRRYALEVFFALCLVLRKREKSPLI